jgi:hypothetical protein
MSFAESFDVFATGDSGEASNGVFGDVYLPEISTEYLIIGTGPAGASLACFLASYGMLAENFHKWSYTHGHFRFEWHCNKPIF